MIDLPGTAAAVGTILLCQTLRLDQKIDRSINVYVTVTISLRLVVSCFYKNVNRIWRERCAGIDQVLSNVSGSTKK